MEMPRWSVLLLLVSTFLVAESNALHANISEVQGYTKLASWNYSSLYRIEVSAGYENNPLLIHLVGSRYDIGYAYGFLLTKEIEENYHSLLYSLLGDKWYDKVLVDLLADALDWQWNDYLSVDVPSIYKTELKGLAEGAAANGCKDCGRYVTRAIVLANAPGDLQDFVYILLREFHNNSSNVSINGAQVEDPHGMQCSMFAVWGDRTANAELFSARNLDWNKDTGVNKNKLVMVVVPIDGGFASVSLGFVGLYGTLAGMSVRGITVHEANLEENEISFTGFPWTLRLRYIMEFATDLRSAKQLWESTANTVGFNHMIASAKDAQVYRSGQETDVALALETMHGYTAYFADNDPRESNATYCGQSVHIGFPLKEAVWRTNHGYDPVIRQHYLWSQSPSADSLRRYKYIHDALVDYQNAGTRIGIPEALNITAIVGDKGHEHPYECMDNNDGTNVLSVTFQPERQTLYSAWERSAGENWRPAVCSTYIKFELSPWFGPRPPLSE